MITEFIGWWFDLKGFELILWSIAILFSFLFLIHTIISLFIGGGEEDYSGDYGGDGFHFFTIRNLIMFFTMFGWSGLAAYKAGLGSGVSLVIAVVCGGAMIAMIYFFMKNAHKLRNSGTLQMQNAVAQVGETYLRIPAQRGGMGKIHLQVQGRLMELDAMTDDSEDIATGKPIQVVSALNNQILIVTSNLI